MFRCPPISFLAHQRSFLVYVGRQRLEQILMPALIDLKGQRFGAWIVQCRGPNAGTITRWWCLCVCGNRRLVQAGHLRQGRSVCCGCIREPRKHGSAAGGYENFPAEYRVWRAMRDRVYNPNNKDYRYYGGKGVTICKSWDEFNNFLADMGKRPSAKHSIHRIMSNKSYTPSNCRWATRKEQVADLPQNQKGYRQRRTRNRSVK